MKSRRFKKGFTLVELLVVIAILAVLAGVSVIGYLSFTSQARTSADEQAVTQMNIALEAQEAIDPPEGVEEAKDVLEAAGFTVDDYVPLDKENIFYYDDNETRVLIFDQEDEKVTFPQELAELYSSVSKKQGFWFPLNDKTYIWETLDPGSLSGNFGGEYRTFVKNSDDTTLFKLSTDFNLNSNYFYEGAGADPKVPRWFFATNANGKLNLDLDGHTLSIPLLAEIGGYAGFNGDKEPEVSDITISNGTIDLTGVSGGFTINEDSFLTLKDCKVVTTSSKPNANYNQFNVLDGARLTLTNCTLEAPNGDTCSVFLGGLGSETNIFNSTLTSTTYGITSNAGEGQSDNIKVKVYNSTVTTLNGPAVLVNVKGSYDLEGSTFNGNGIGVSIRGGNATIDNCDISITLDNTATQDLLTSEGTNTTVGKDTWEFAKIPGFTNDQKGEGKFNFTNPDGSWGDGLGVQFGALVLGDWNLNAYNYDTTCTLTGTEIHMDDKWTALPIVYLAQDGDRTTTLNYDSACKFFKGQTAYTAVDAIVKLKDPFANSDKIGTMVANAIQ